MQTSKLSFFVSSNNVHFIIQLFIILVQKSQPSFNLFHMDSKSYYQTIERAKYEDTQQKALPLYFPTPITIIDDKH